MVLELNEMCVQVLACGEDLHVQELVPELPEEALDMAVLPGRTWFDVACLYPVLREETLRPLSTELRPVVEAELLRLAVHHKKPCELPDKVASPYRRPCLKKKALP